MKKRIFLILIAFSCAFLSIFTISSNKVFANNIMMRTVIRLHTSTIYITRGSQSDYENMRNNMINGYITDVTLRAYIIYSDGTSKTLNLHGFGDDYSYGSDEFKFTYSTQIGPASSQNLTVTGPTSLTRTDILTFFGTYPYSIYLQLLENDGKYLRFIDESDYTGNINIISNIYFKADMIITKPNEGIVATLTGLDVTTNNWDVLYTFPSLDDAYNAGYNDGYRAGGGFSGEDRYRQGYNDGYNAGVSGTITTNWFTSFIDSIFSIFNVEIFPNVKFIYLIFIPLGLGIIALIFKLIRG